MENLKILYINNLNNPGNSSDFLYIEGEVGVSFICTPWLAPWEIDPDLPLDRGGVDYLKFQLRHPLRVNMFNP